MPPAPLPPDEAARLADLRSFAILDTPYDPRFDRLVQLAARVFGTQGAVVTLLDADRLWFKAHIGIADREMPRELGFCSWAVLSDELCVAEDLQADARFSDNPLVTASDGLRFYAGAPLISRDGHCIGTLAIFDSVARRFDAAQRAHLKEFAGLVLDALELHRSLAETETAREEAMLASRSKGEFLAFMSHELRTPLNAVIGFAEMLESEAYGPLGDSHYKEYAGLIHQAGQHLLEVINSILDLSRIEAGKMTLTLDRLKVVDEADAVISLLLTQARQKELSLVMDASLHALPVLHADRSAFRQVLLNLISNAIKFTRPEGRIVVTGATDADSIRISVGDDGPGIAPADLVRLGEAFYQAGPKNQRRQGSGLGLAISHRLMALHGGRLNIASDLGRGTTATMVFPLKQS
ncbi:MAG: GAF domain-containing sensor histidine kinase [Ferrovibrio sp.]|uniref:GAF domain-containing sensor histidine kinase n=1 Tax=Ferrovibrio sp. TaxID=1917215 RepID=UPI00261CF310|nr:GAF domain-containing sensor histidine kinase [Ferrovibrio sp.]MCW0232971.1 GAF domain-containing sensor histidine kinase [Ferrovibrio sp.]